MALHEIECSDLAEQALRQKQDAEEPDQPDRSKAYLADRPLRFWQKDEQRRTDDRAKDRAKPAQHTQGQDEDAFGEAW